MPVINNAYTVDDKNYAYSPSDLDYVNKNISDDEMSVLIDSLCDVRMKNPDVMLLDNINNQRQLSPMEQERIELEQESIAVEEEVLKDIFESGSPMTIEERNEYIANGLYSEYQAIKSKNTNSNQAALDQIDITDSLEAEILDEDELSEIISEKEVYEESNFQSIIEENETIDTVEGTSYTTEDIITNTELTEETLPSITEEEAIEMSSSNVLGREEYKNEETPSKVFFRDITNEAMKQYFTENSVDPNGTTAEEYENDKTDVMDIINKFAEFNVEKPKPTKEQIAKIVTGLPTAVAVLTNPTKVETLEKITEELDTTIDMVTSPDKIINALESGIEETNTKDDNGYTPMSIEDFNDVPATIISLPDDVITKALTEQYGDVDARDAAQLITVMNRYKAGEKFNVFQALPESIKRIINQEALAAGADKNTINFFAKSFINDLVNNTYLDKEIQDFNKELSEVMAPMGNIAGTLMDEYNDEVYDKFTKDLIAKSELLRYADNPNIEKADQLVRIANNFTEAVKLTRLQDMIKDKPSLINKYYKSGRDNWNKIISDFNYTTASISPKPRAAEVCYNGLISAGYKDFIAKTITVIAIDSVTMAIEDGTLEEHIYAYYLTNSLMTLGITANTSRIVSDIKTGVSELSNMITDVVLPLIERNTKKQRKRNRKNK